MKKRIIILTIAALALSTHQVQASHHTSHTTAFGAVGGALIGQAMGRNTEATLIGTAVGSLVGYMVGAEMDRGRTITRTNRRIVEPYYPSQRDRRCRKDRRWTLQDPGPGHRRPNMIINHITYIEKPVIYKVKKHHRPRWKKHHRRHDNRWNRHYHGHDRRERIVRW